MSDEPTSGQTAAPATTATTEQPSDAWGDPISAERQAELQAILGAWNAPEAQHGDRKGPFDGVRLTGAEVWWLATKSGKDEHGLKSTLHLQGVDLRGAQLQGANLRGAQLQGVFLLDVHLERADLRRANLERASLGRAYLEGTALSDARLERAELGGAHLEGASLREAHLERASLVGAYLERAALGGAYLERADLRQAHLQGAFLVGAHLERADLRQVRLEGASLREAHLERANLSSTTLDAGTDLTGAVILEPEDRRPLLHRVLRRPRYGPALGDIHWGAFDQVQLTQLKGWEAVHRLADEEGISIVHRVAAEMGLTLFGTVDEHRDAVRAYRQVAQRLRDQGFSDVADRLADRAQVCQRKLLFRQLLADWRRPWRLPGDLMRWLFSWFLALLAGYGYHPGRSVFWYLATITGFAYAYFQVTHGLPLVPPLGPLAPGGMLHFGASSSLQALAPNEALILSVSSFHGRGFFQPLKSLGDPVAGLAAIEAVIGLLIEISFIATFTQRFFGSK